MSTLLSVDRLSVRFGGLTAVNQVSFDIEQGTILSLIGPNGAGKTTLFNAITAVVGPTSGSIRLDGEELIRRWTWRTTLAVLGIALACALAVQIATDCEGWWQAAINDQYQYRKPFAWNKAFVALIEHMRNLGLWPAIIGAVIGGAGAITIWHSMRRVPEFVHDRGIARTFQNIRLFREMTCLENILVGMGTGIRYSPWSALIRWPRFNSAEAQARSKARHLLASVDLTRVADLTAGELPYGHQRRLEIARALAHGPRLLLLDEPAAGMNPAEAADLMRVIRLIRDRGVTVLLIEHHMNVVMGISDRIVVLDYGNKIAEGTPEQVRNDPRVIEAYLGKDAS